MKRIIEECSKDGKTWMVFAEFTISDDDVMFLPDHEYAVLKQMAITLGYKHWRTKKEES